MYRDFIEAILIDSIPALEHFEFIGEERDLFDLGLTKEEVPIILRKMQDCLKVKISSDSVSEQVFTTINSIDNWLQHSVDAVSK